MKRFKNIITSKDDFNSKIWLPLGEFGWVEKPLWYTNPRYITSQMLFLSLTGEYGEVFSRSTEDIFVNKLINALAQLMPEAYMRTLNLTNETMNKIDWNSILATTTETGFENGKNTSETFSASSSSPSNENNFDNFTNEKASEKDYIKNIDNRLSVQNIKDVSKAIGDISSVRYSGVIISLIRHPLIRECFDFNYSEEAAVNDGELVLEKGDPGPQGPQGPQGESADLTNYYTKNEVQNYVALNTGSGSDQTVDLGEYYKKEEVDTRFNNLATQSVSFLTNYMTSLEINRDFLNKTVTDIQDVKGTIAGPKFINNSTNLPTANSNELATTEYVDNRLTTTGTFVKESYFQDKAELLTANQPGVSTDSASIGIGFEGTQNYGLQAKGIQQYGYQARNKISVGNSSRDKIEIGNNARDDINIGRDSEGNIYIGQNTKGIVNIGSGAITNLFFGSSKWGTQDAPVTNGVLISGNAFSTFREVIDKAKEKVDSFVATGNTAAPLGTINDSTSQFFNGGTITTGNTVKLDFINANYTFTENITPGFSLINNDTKKLNIGQSNKRVFIKVGVIINSFSGASVGQLEIALKSGSIDIGTDSIVLINPNPNAFFVKTIGVLNSDLVKQEGISISLTSQNGNFVIGGLEVILL